MMACIFTCKCQATTGVSAFHRLVLSFSAVECMAFPEGPSTQLGPSYDGIMVQKFAIIGVFGIYSTLYLGTWTMCWTWTLQTFCGMTRKTSKAPV